MHEDHRPVAGKHKVRLSRQVPGMQPVPEPGAVKLPAQRQLRLRIAAAYAGHPLGSLGRGEEVRHAATRQSRGAFVSATSS